MPLDASPDCLELLEADGRLVFIDPYSLRQFAASQPGRLPGSHWPRLDASRPEAAQARAALEAAGRGQVTRFRASSPKPGGGQCWWDVTVAPIPAEEGQTGRILVISRDVTAEEEARVQTGLLVRELQHRVRNAFATAGAIANQTLRDEGSTAAAKASLQKRLAAVSRAHEMLAEQDWAGADLASLAAAVLAVHELPAQPRRFLIDGPRLLLSARAATAFSLLLHELATNAVRHGALGQAQGRVSVIWQVDAEGRFQLDWCEAGGPAVRPPARRGFGTRLIEQAVPDQLGGAGRIDYDAEGLRFCLTTRCERLAATG